MLIDSTPAPPPDPAEVSAWAAQQSVFVSSVMAGMHDEREAVVQAVKAVGAIPVRFEEFGGRDDDPEDAYLGSVATADIYLGILGARYGRPLKSGYSATHAEYNEAVSRGLRISVWEAGVGLDGPQRDFLEAVRVFHTTGSYGSPDDLARRVEQRLRELAGESLTPWAKVGNTVFRASSITVDSKRITVSGRIRDNTVAASLEARRPDHWNRSAHTTITWPGGTSTVRVTDVETAVKASKTRFLTISADRAAGTEDTTRLNMAFNGHTSEELTEIAVRVALLGEPNPFVRDHMGFMVEMVNPLPAVEGRGLSEDAVQQVAEILLTEALVGSGRAEHLSRFRLGPKRNGRRRIALSWVPVRRYSNSIPDPRSVEGEVTVGS